ncbi:hypothetical protein IQ259_06425 [Fortiea sp. LEGE XX443]|nr:hypothetical protein [Fortiea sp. LEGE XX443]MBE9004677.1 hypothetical protein [Fortiea sp. LEGE XX443]
MRGASQALIQAVRNGDEPLIQAELSRIQDGEHRQHLTRSIQRLGPTLG